MKNIRNNLRSYLLYFVFPLPLAACWAANRWKTGRRPLIVIIAAAVPIAYFVLLHYRPLWTSLNLANSLDIVGFVALADLLFEALRRRERYRSLPHALGSDSSPHRLLRPASS